LIVPESRPNYDLRTGKSVAEWLQAVQGTAENVLVFVHGFADGSMKVLGRHNAIKRHLPPDFTLVSFDWPAGNYKVDPFDGYLQDKDYAKQSGPRLIDDCLQVLLRGSDASRVHLFAHSMGAFVTETAFRVIPGGGTKIGNVFLVAADVNRENYANGSGSLEIFLSKCTDLTAYWNTQDDALEKSITMPGNNYIPLGLQGFPDRDVDLPNKHSLQCTDYFNIYVKHVSKPIDEVLAWPHIWYILFDPKKPPPLENDFYIDVGEVLDGPLTHPTRAVRNTLRSVSPSLA
jgi:pimeloyl-ACP methyl ester carboxylesterase